MQIESIKKYMKEKKITYEDLAQRSGLSISTIKKVFAGISQYPRLDTVQAIEKALNITAPLEWTEDDKKNGVGNYPTYLSDEEREWQDLRTDILITFGEEYFLTLQKMLHSSVENFQKNQKKP